jgi:DNA polymerase III alpha subunit
VILTLSRRWDAISGSFSPGAGKAPFGRLCLRTGRPPGTEQDLSEKALLALVERFGSDNVVVELFDHQHPLDSVHNDFLASLAARHSLPTVVTGLVHYATPAEADLAQAMAAVRARTSMESLTVLAPLLAQRLSTLRQRAASTVPSVRRRRYS